VLTEPSGFIVVVLFFSTVPSGVSRRSVRVVEPTVGAGIAVVVSVVVVDWARAIPEPNARGMARNRVVIFMVKISTKHQL
jgi:hypothetical protein